MNGAVAIIRDEHRSMAAVLKSLLREVDAARDGTAPDVPLYGAMLDYLQAFPERLHHPKEDEYLFRLLRRRCSAAAPLLDDLEAQHVSGGVALRDLRAALADVAAGGNVKQFAELLQRYADYLWAHMKMEEEQVLPLAQEHLTAADWREIDAAFAINREAQW